MNMHFIMLLAFMTTAFFVLAFFCGADAAPESNLDSRDVNNTSLNTTIQDRNETNSADEIMARTYSIHSRLPANNSSFIIEGTDANRSAFKLGNANKPTKNASELWHLIQGINHNKVP
jgi:hypothetical protein